MSKLHSVQWPVVGMIAARLLVRERPASDRVRVSFRVAAILTVLASLGLAGGWSSPWLVAVVGGGAMVTLATGCIRLFPPAMAVSIVGVALSCASLMTALSVTAGFEQEMMSSVARVGGHVRMSKYGLDFFEYEDVARQWLDDPRVTAASPFAVATVAIVGGVAPGEEAAPTAVSADADPWDVALQAEVDSEVSQDGVGPSEDELPPALPVVAMAKGIDPQWAAGMDGFAETLGRGDLSGLRPGDTRHRPGIVVGVALARILGVEPGDFVRVVVPAEIHMGSSVTSEPPRHAVFEVLDTFRTGTSEFDRHFVMMHLTAAQSLFFREGRVTGIEFQLEDASLAQAVADEMIADPKRWYRASTWKETNAVLLQGLRQIRVALSVILGLMVLVAASSLIASLLLVVRRKRLDIAVMSAMGSDGSLTFWAFEAVGLLAGLVGAGFGLAMGGLFCAVVAWYEYPLGSDIYPVDHLPVMVRWIDALGPAGVAVGLCSVASGPVAVLATKVRVLETLRR